MLPFPPAPDVQLAQVEPPQVIARMVFVKARLQPCRYAPAPRGFNPGNRRNGQFGYIWGRF